LCRDGSAAAWRRSVKSRAARAGKKGKNFPKKIFDKKKIFAIISVLSETAVPKTGSLDLSKRRRKRATKK
jgi:hypothetical protein